MVKKEWKQISWIEFCSLIQGKKMLNSEWDYANSTSEKAIELLTFDDGTVVRAVSNYEGPWSELTPGEGVMPPTIEVEA